MAKHPARCPKCGVVLEVDAAVGEQIICPACQAFLCLPGKAKFSDNVDPLIGESLGQFEVLELLGRGGMGAVYKARQASLDRSVAIKVMPQSFSRDASFVERFHREARAAAAVNHPNIIEVYDVGADHGFQFIAMEFIEGETLADFLEREGRLSPERALEILKQVASALAGAHERGILHRDIKPSNILIDAGGRVKVADFGLAKREGVDVGLTTTGQSLGTPLYMPPEGARAAGLDARSDLYSLGATVYQALAGRPPFDGTTPAELVVKHVEAQVPPLQKLAPDAPPALCRVIHRLLRKNPAERYPSAQALLNALGKVEARVLQQAATRTMANDRGPVGGASLPRVPLSDRLAKQQRQRRLALIAGAAGLAAILVVVLILALSRKGDRPPSAVLPSGPPSTLASPAPRLERNAGIVFNNIQACINRRDWDKALAYLDRFEAVYGTTRFYAAHRADIASLRKQIAAALRPEPPKPGTSQPVTPRPPRVKPAPWTVDAQWPFDAAEAKRRQAETAKALGVPIEQDIDIGNGLKMTFVLIPAGEFLMGHPDTPSTAELHKAYGPGGLQEWLEWERPQHPVRISKPFWLGKFEVTQEQWQTVMGQNPSVIRDKPQNPVERVSWHDCQAFLQKLGAKLGKTFRLPTEAEWEYACRAGAATEFYFGDGATDLGSYAWFSANSGNSTQPVGRKKPNAWGLHDMAGNVAEWCEDWYAPYDKGVQTDPKGPQTGDHRVFRGGVWQFNAMSCRSASRGISEQGGARWPTLGLRACLVAGPR